MPATLRNASPSAGFTALEDIRCSEVSILNTSGEVLNIQMDGDRGEADAHFIALPDGKAVSIPVVSNAKEIRIKGDGLQTVQLVMQ
jgi:hypothetical protein